MTLSQPTTSLIGENDRLRTNKSSHQSSASRAAGANRTGAGGVVTLILLVFLTGLYYGGYFDRLRTYLSAPLERTLLNAGINLQKIQIKGQVALANRQVIEALGIAPGQSLIGFDAIKAQKQLSRLGQVKSARVMRLLPSTLLVEIVERIPVARWLHDGQLDLIDAQGVVLRNLASDEEANYPLVVGRGASEGAAQLIRLLSAHQDLSGRIRMAERVSQYRWNLYAKSGAIIKLPPFDLALGLARLVQLPEWRELLGQKRLVIDLRNSVQAFVRLKTVVSASSMSSL